MNAQTFFQSPGFRIFKRNFEKDLMKHQTDALDFMDLNNPGNICAPTGTGKSRIIYSDLLDKIQFNTLDTFVIVSHRLLLNIQHLDGIFELFKNLLPHVGIIYVGSYQIDPTNYINDPELNSRLLNANISIAELISSSINKSDINNKIAEHKRNGRDVIVISTYHSLDKLEDTYIHTLYCDEAHFLASPKERRIIILK